MASCCSSDGCSCMIEAGSGIHVSGVGTSSNPFVITNTGSGGGGGAVTSVNGDVGDVVLTKSDIGLSNADNTSDLNKPISLAMGQAVQWAKVPDTIITGTINRDSNNVVTTADVIWPDGATGVFTTDVVGASHSIDSYHITYVNGAIHHTFTQPLVTRNGAGYTTNVPAIVVT